jgi:hypothetical protein
MQNNDNNPVLIAVNSSNVFTQPEGPYYLGQEMEYGGKIVYIGYDSLFEHVRLVPGKQYYYRIWSYDEDLKYSKGLTIAETTPCGKITIFPHTEGFNNEILPLCWTQEFISGNTPWQIGVGNNADFPITAFEGPTNTFFRLSTSSFEGDATLLISPEFDLSIYDKATLSFYYANPAEDENQDFLNVYVKNTLDEGWVLLENFNDDQPDWALVEIDLTGMIGKIMIGFEGVANGGHGISIDKVQITASWDIPPPVNLTYEVLDLNKVRLSWDIVEIENEKYLNLQRTGFHVFRNDKLIYKGNDNSQTFFDDYSLPVGNFTYYVTANYEGGIESSPSNQVLVSIIETGTEIMVNIFNSGSGKTDPKQGEYMFLPQSEIMVSALPDTHSYLEKWVVNDIVEENLNPLIINVTEPLNIVAYFSINNYELVLVSDPPEAAESLTGAGIFEYGSNVEIYTKPSVGYVFSHWNNGSTIVSTNPLAIIELAGDTYLTAVFIRKDYSVDLEVQPAEAGTATGQGIYGANSIIQIEAIENDGWLFVKWVQIGNGFQQEVSSGPIYEFIANSNKYFVAVFEKFYPKLTIEIQGDGTTTPGAGTYTFDFDQEINLEAIPDEGWRFVHWNVDGDIFTEDKLSFMLRSNSTVLAVFEPKVYVSTEQFNKSLIIFPVPAKQSFYIKFPSPGYWLAEIVSVHGQVVARKYFDSIAESPEEYNLENINKGVYLIRAINGEILLHQKIIIQ